MPAADEGKLDFLCPVADAHVGADEVALMLLPVARPDMRLVGDGSHHRLGEVSLVAVQDNVELHPVARQFDDLLHINGRAARPGISLGDKVLDAPLRDIHRLLPANNLGLVCFHAFHQKRSDNR